MGHGGYNPQPITRDSAGFRRPSSIGRFHIDAESAHSGSVREKRLSWPGVSVCRQALAGRSRAAREVDVQSVGTDPDQFAAHSISLVGRVRRLRRGDRAEHHDETRHRSVNTVRRSIRDAEAPLAASPCALRAYNSQVSSSRSPLWRQRAYFAHKGEGHSAAADGHLGTLRTAGRTP